MYAVHHCVTRKCTTITPPRHCNSPMTKVPMVAGCWASPRRKSQASIYAGDAPEMTATFPNLTTCYMALFTTVTHASALWRRRCLSRRRCRHQPGDRGVVHGHRPHPLTLRCALASRHRRHGRRAAGADQAEQAPLGGEAARAHDAQAGDRDRQQGCACAPRAEWG
jgi:hypothetical protein